MTTGTTARYVNLSKRETDVLRAFMLDGADNETVGRRMRPNPLSVETVKTHMQNLYAKTGTATRAGLVVAVARKYVVPLHRGVPVEF